MTVHPKNPDNEYVHQFGYGNKMNVSNYEEGVVGNQGLKADENKEETDIIFWKIVQSAGLYGSAFGGNNLSI